MDKVKKLKIKLNAAIFLLVCLVIFSGFVSPDMRNFALALSSNYGKIMPATLTLTEWNYLDDDFVAKSGDTMTGILNMSTHRITGVDNPSAGTDAANKNYVDTQIAAMASASAAATFTNWGQPGCPSGSTVLYSGAAFSAYYGSIGGSGNTVCLDSMGAAGGLFTEPNSDKLYPVLTGATQSLPAVITSNRVVQCAVCRKVGTCYVTYGNTACNTSLGFNVAYSGYLLGAHSNSGTYVNSTARVCVNESFNNSVIPSSSDGAILVGTRIDNTLGLGYSANSFVRCSVCCN